MPPSLSVTAERGFVPENSDLGARVKDGQGNDVRFLLSDGVAGGGAGEGYEYELTTTFFKVDSEGHLVVAERGLDRDPPNEPMLRFQVSQSHNESRHDRSEVKWARYHSKCLIKVFVRETEGARRSSAPVSLTVELLDENDNAPVIEGGVTDISLAAGNTRRKVALLRATDIDSSSQADGGGLRYRLVRVSNNGMRKFLVHPTSGQVEVVGRVGAGERYSLTVAAADSGGKSSQTVIEVRVTAGPNLRGPVFGQFLYEASVSEGAPKFSSVVATSARDPEGGPVTYSISGGNDEGHFQIEESTGVVRVMDPLDRERSDKYKLVSELDKG